MKTTVILRPGHNIPTEYISGAVLDHDIIELEQFHEGGGGAYGVAHSNEDPLKSRIVYLRDSQIEERGELQC